VGPGAWVAPEAWAVLEAWVVLEAWAASVVLAAWVAQVTVRLNYPPAAIPGSTTHKTVAAPRIPIGLQRTDLAARLAEIHSPTVRPAPGSRLTDRAGMWPVIVAEVREPAIVPAV
jgi:hypothetical protein